MTTCQVCGTEADDDSVIVLEGRRVCPACKPMIVQQLKEGVLRPLEVPIDVADHEFRFGELMQKTWSICRQDWPVLVGLKLVAIIPLVLFQLWLYWGAGGHATYVTSHVTWIRVGLLLICVVGELGVVWVVNERVAGRSLSFAEALGKALPRWLPALGTNVLELLALFLLMLLLIVPGILFAGYFMFTIYVVALRGCSGPSALAYSKRLVEGRWWSVFGTSLGLTLLSRLPVIPLMMVRTHFHQSPLVTIPFDLSRTVTAIFIEVGMTLLFLNLDALRRKTPPGEVALVAEPRESTEA